MKRLYYIATLAIALFASVPMQAQEEAGNAQQQQQRRRGPVSSRGAREEDKKESGMPELTVRAQDMNERMTQNIGNARWMRVIYRQIDLTKEQNAPLYYPTQPMNGQMNLFSIIFQLVCEGKLSAYEYLDGYEDFSDNRKLDLKVMLDRCRIFYEETPGKDNEPASFVVNESDIPSGDVRSYYIKEAWYFDQNNSVFDVKTLAICPILTIVDDMGQNTMPMFWRTLLMSTFLLVISYPSTKICPSVASSRRFRHRRNVDFPPPEGPITQTTSPSATVRSMPLRTSRW